MAAISVPVDPTTLALFPQALMCDAYRLIVDEEALDASTAANRMFGGMPWWIRALMAMRNRLVAPLGLKTGRDEAKTTSRRIGFFPIVTETPERVVLGLDDKHLDFRIAVDVAKLEGARRQITTTTLVRSRNLFGRLYLAAVLPFHRIIVPSMLRQADKN